MLPYDLIVIGSGPGEQRAAIQGAKAGKRVAIVERQSAIGGVCINSGTIPGKTMREAVLHLSGFYSKNFYGAHRSAATNITMADVVFRVQRVVENEVGVTQDQLKRNAWSCSMVPVSSQIHTTCGLKMETVSPISSLSTS
jgi:NAD(P) transhydrogenase